MNAVAVLVGSLYGLAALGATYFVSMVASGLFTRSFYRIYARVLIGVCSVMVAAPLLKYVAGNPLAASLLLTVAGYLATGLLAYGVVRFNREFLQTVFLDRRLTAYFIFGTLANALVVTLVLLQESVGPTSARGTTDHF
jgi:hypothetical protein